MRTLKYVIILAVTAAIGLTAGCQNQAAKMGGTTTLNLPAGERLVEITWKDGNSLWYLTRPREANERPTTYRFQERSNAGMVQGTVVVIEH